MSSQDACRHQQCRQRNHRFSRFVHTPSASDTKTGSPASNKTSRTGGHIGNPGKDANLFQAETANIIEIKREPDDVKPPDRISEKSREHNGPYLAILQKLPPTGTLHGSRRIAVFSNECVFLGRKQGVLLRRVIEQEPQ